MSPKSFLLTDELHRYLLDHTSPLDEVQRDLIAETAGLGDIAVMQIAPEQGAFMGLLARAIGARRIIEVGTFTGYSALCLASALPDDGVLLACDVSEDWTAIGRRAWERAGVADRIDLRIAPAAETLAALPEEATWDLAFVDADKPSYPIYFDLLVPRLRPDGLLLVDNVLWSGNVVDPVVTDEHTQAIRDFNDRAAADARVEAVMLPISDGLSIFRRRA